LDQASGQRFRGSDAFEGVVREIDLDALRFEIRGARYQRGIRCIYDDRHKPMIKKILDHTVRVTGSYEAEENEQPRLVSVEAIEVLRKPDEQIALFTN
jgi:hypothetical protein